jgi:hypothetical protein
MRAFVSVAVAVLVSSTAHAAVLCAKPRKDGTFDTAVRIRETCKATEVVLGRAGVGFCCSLPTTTSTTTSTTLRGEMLTVPFCGFSDAVTAQSYSGLINITVSGIGETTPGNPLKDAFYELVLGDTNTASAPDSLVFRLARQSQSACTCLTEAQCQPNVAVASLLVGTYPAFRPDHTYTVTLDLGTGAPDRLAFGFADCGCGDNSGTFTVIVQAQ